MRVLRIAGASVAASLAVVLGTYGCKRSTASRIEHYPTGWTQLRLYYDRAYPWNRVLVHLHRPLFLTEGRIRGIEVVLYDMDFLGDPANYGREDWDWGADIVVPLK
jgi:hypothetical protein